MTVVPTGYLKSHPATKQEAQLKKVEQSARHFCGLRIRVCKGMSRSVISLPCVEMLKAEVPCPQWAGLPTVWRVSGYSCATLAWRRSAMEKYRLTRVRICLTIRLVLDGSVFSTSWSDSKVGSASRKFSTSCCFCSRGMRTRVRPVPLDVRAYRAGTSSPKVLRDSRSASLRSFRTMGATFFSSLVLLTARSSSILGRSRYAAMHRYQPPCCETATPAFAISLRICASTS